MHILRACSRKYGILYMCKNTSLAYKNASTLTHKQGHTTSYQDGNNSSLNVQHNLSLPQNRWSERIIRKRGGSESSRPKG